VCASVVASDAASTAKTVLRRQTRRPSPARGAWWCKAGRMARRIAGSGASMRRYPQAVLLKPLTPSSSGEGEEDGNRVYRWEGEGRCRWGRREGKWGRLHEWAGKVGCGGRKVGRLRLEGHNGQVAFCCCRVSCSGSWHAAARCGGKPGRRAQRRYALLPALRPRRSDMIRCRARHDA